MRSLLISSALLLVTIWSVSSGVDDKAEVVVPSGFLCPNCYERAKSVLEKAWTLTDPLVTSYGVLVYNILKFDIPKAQVGRRFWWAEYLVDGWKKDEKVCKLYLWVLGGV